MDGKDVVPDVWEVLDKIKTFTDKVRLGEWVRGGMGGEGRQGEGRDGQGVRKVEEEGVVLKVKD